ncbi:hypothetical protein HZH68_016019 [Vespula germanica]|uniref:Uncharacterized protein n=1 Tax=Vespula germanica TaxID=30212 RepID=A0A834J3Q0_VESGE|nr:hypothetical protein HZH68_016019 [Vespula germanica]
MVPRKSLTPIEFTVTRLLFEAFGKSSWVEAAREGARQGVPNLVLPNGKPGVLAGLLRWPTLGAEYITLTTVEVIPSQWANTSKSRLPVICGGLSAPVSSARTSPPVTAMFAVSSLPLRCSQLGDINLKESEKGPEVGRSAVFGETQEHLFVEAETVPSQRTEVTPQRICRQGGPTEALYHGPRGLPHDDSKNFYSPYNYG